MDIAQFLPYVHDQLPGVSQPVATRALVDAARSFFIDTGVWQVDATPINLKADKALYQLDVGAGQAVVSVIDVQRATDKGYLRPMPNTKVIRASGRGAPSMYFVSGDFVELGPVPIADAAKALAVRVAVTIKRTSTEIPDALADEYIREISAKARLDLALQPNYASPAVAAAAQQEYLTGFARAKRRGFFGYGAYAPQIVLTGW